VARPMPLQRFQGDINRSIADVVESMRPQADKAHVALRADRTLSPLYIEGGPTALSRVYRNLISNAIQATAAGGRVAVATSGTGARVIVQVADTGCGIPPERLGSIFDDFVTTKHRGLGLGLAITKRIVEQLGGSVTVTSEVGRGTTFVLDFPAVDVPALEAAAG